MLTNLRRHTKLRPLEKTLTWIIQSNSQIPLPRLLERQPDWHNSDQRARQNPKFMRTLKGSTENEFKLNETTKNIEEESYRNGSNQTLIHAMHEPANWERGIDESRGFSPPAATLCTIYPQIWCRFVSRNPNPRDKNIIM